MSGPALAAEETAAVCRKWHIVRLARYMPVPGSFANMPQPDDVYLLAEFKRGATPGYIALAELELSFATLVDGAHVEVRTIGEISRYARPVIQSEAEVIYDERR